MASEKPTEKEITDRIKFASGLYSEARSKMDEVEDLFTGEYVVKEEIEDQEVEPIKPPRPMAILFKFVSRLATRAEMGIQVIPRVLSDTEEEACTTLERWLEGFKFQSEYEAESPLYRYFVTWFLLRGRGCLELRLREDYAKTGEYLPIRVIADDPKKISPVYGETGIMYYAKEYERYAWDLQQELSEPKALWDVPSKLAAMEATKKVDVKEYWDRDWHAALIDDEVVYLKENPYGFIPLKEAKAMDTPLEDAEWASQSVLGPLVEVLEKQAGLMSKVISATELFYWPRLFIETPDGRSFIIESTPGVMQNVPPGSKMKVIAPVPNQMLVQQLNAMLESEINLIALPEIAWGAEPGTLQSGRAISQVLAQTLDVIEDKRQNLERALGWHFGDALRLVEKFAPLADNDKFSVMAEPQEPGRKRRDLIAIGKEEVAGHHRVTANLSPPLPEDKMGRYEVARRAKELGIDLYTIMTQILDIPDPDNVKERMEKEMYEAMSPEIMEYKRQKYLEEFCEEEGVSIEKLMAMIQPPGPPGAEGAEGEIGRPPPEVMPPGEPETPGPEEEAALRAAVEVMA